MFVKAAVLSIVIAAMAIDLCVPKSATPSRISYCEAYYCRTSPAVPPAVKQLQLTLRLNF